MTVDGQPIPAAVAVPAGLKIAVALRDLGLTAREMTRMSDEEWESAYVSLCAADPVYRMYDYL